MSQNPFENLTTLWSQLESTTGNGAPSVPPVAPPVAPPVTSVPVTALTHPFTALTQAPPHLPLARRDANGNNGKEGWLKKNKTWIILGGIGIVVAAVAVIFYFRKNNVWGKKGQDDGGMADIMGLPEDPTSGLMHPSAGGGQSMHPSQMPSSVPSGPDRQAIGHVPPQGHPPYPHAGGQGPQAQIPTGMGAPFPGQQDAGPQPGQPWFNQPGMPAGGMQRPQQAQWSQGAPGGMPHPFQPQLPPQNVQYQQQQQGNNDNENKDVAIHLTRHGVVMHFANASNGCKC